MKETKVQSLIIRYLLSKNHFVLRVNNFPAYDTKRKAYRKMPIGTRKGVPDILVQWNGFPVWLEVKTDKGKQSKEQIEFQNDCKKQNIEYYVVRSLKDIKDLGL